MFIISILCQRHGYKTKAPTSHGLDWIPETNIHCVFPFCVGIYAHPPNAVNVVQTFCLSFSMEQSKVGGTVPTIPLVQRNIKLEYAAIRIYESRLFFLLVLRSRDWPTAMHEFLVRPQRPQLLLFCISLIWICSIRRQQI